MRQLLTYSLPIYEGVFMTYTPCLHKTRTMSPIYVLSWVWYLFQTVVTDMQSPEFMVKRLKYIQPVGIDLLI